MVQLIGFVQTEGAYQVDKAVFPIGNGPDLLYFVPLILLRKNRLVLSVSII